MRPVFQLENGCESFFGLDAEQNSGAREDSRGPNARVQCDIAREAHFEYAYWHGGDPHCRAFFEKIIYRTARPLCREAGTGIA